MPKVKITDIIIGERVRVELGSFSAVKIRNWRQNGYFKM